MMNTGEEFTFPIITASNTTVVHLSAVSSLPPLWRIPSINSGADSDHGRRRITKILTVTASFSGENINYSSGDHHHHHHVFSNDDDTNNNNNSEDQYQNVHDVKSEEAELEKMDVLWEDFNEELLLQSSSTTTGSSIVSDQSHHHHHHLHSNTYVYGEESGRRNAQGYCNDDELEEKSTKKNKNLELVVKMLKKVFLLQNVPTIKKTGPIS